MKERNRDSRTDMPLNPPDVPIEQKQRELEGDRPRDEQAAYIDRSDTDDLGELTSTALDEGELDLIMTSSVYTGSGMAMPDGQAEDSEGADAFGLHGQIWITTDALN